MLISTCPQLLLEVAKVEVQEEFSLPAKPEPTEEKLASQFEAIFPCHSHQNISTASADLQISLLSSSSIPFDILSRLVGSTGNSANLPTNLFTGQYLFNIETSRHCDTTFKVFSAIHELPEARPILEKIGKRSAGSRFVQTTSLPAFAATCKIETSSSSKLHQSRGHDSDHT